MVFNHRIKNQLFVVQCIMKNQFYFIHGYFMVFLWLIRAYFTKLFYS